MNTSRKAYTIPFTYFHPGSSAHVEAFPPEMVSPIPGYIHTGFRLRILPGYDPVYLPGILITLGTEGRRTPTGMRPRPAPSVCPSVSLKKAISRQNIAPVGMGSTAKINGKRGLLCPGTLLIHQRVRRLHRRVLPRRPMGYHGQFRHIRKHIISVLFRQIGACLFASPEAAVHSSLACTTPHIPGHTRHSRFSRTKHQREDSRPRERLLSISSFAFYRKSQTPFALRALASCLPPR